MAAREELRGYPFEQIPFDITPSTAGENTIIRARVAAKHIVVRGYVLITHADAIAKFLSSDGLAINDEISGSLTSDFVHKAVQRNNEYGLFWTAKNQDLVLNLDAVVRCSGYLSISIAPKMPPITLAI